MVSEHGRGFWVVLDPPTDGVDSRVAFMPEGPGLAALESPELAELLTELLARYDPAYRPPSDLRGPFNPARDHLLVIFEGAPPTCTGWTGASTRPRRCWWWSPEGAGDSQGRLHQVIEREEANPPQEGTHVAEDYPYEAKHKIVALVATLEPLTKRDPEQEVQGIALPVLDAVIEAARSARPDDPVVQAARGIITPEQIASGEPVRAADALLVAKQLDAAIGAYPLVIA